jgi:hypothetical protein
MDGLTCLVWLKVFPYVHSGKDRLSLRATCKHIFDVVDEELRIEFKVLTRTLPFPLAMVKRYHVRSSSGRTAKVIWELSFFAAVKRFIVQTNSLRNPDYTVDLCQHGNRKFIVYKDHVTEPFHEVIYEGCYDPTNQAEPVINAYSFYLKQTRDADIKVHGRKDGRNAPSLVTIARDEGRSDYEEGFPYSLLHFREELMKHDGDFSTRPKYTSSTFGVLRFNWRLDERKMAKKAGCDVLIPPRECLLTVLASLRPEELGRLDTEEKPLSETPFRVRFSNVNRNLWKMQLGPRTNGYLTPDTICLVTSVLGRTGIEVKFLKHGLHYSCSVAKDYDMHYYEIRTDKWKEIYDEGLYSFHIGDKKSVRRRAILCKLPIYHTGHSYVLANTFDKQQTPYPKCAISARLLIAHYLSPGYDLTDLSREVITGLRRKQAITKAKNRPDKKAKLIHDYFS